jgi:hypothetical protein
MEKLKSSTLPGLKLDPSVVHSADSLCTDCATDSIKIDLKERE